MTCNHCSKKKKKKRVIVGLEKRRELLRHIWYCNVDYNIIRISITILIKKKSITMNIKETE